MYDNDKLRFKQMTPSKMLWDFVGWWCQS